MLKKTTIYLEEIEIETLKRISFIQNKSMTELIRNGIQELCRTIPKEDIKVIEAIGELRAMTKSKALTPRKIMSVAIAAQKEVRHGREKNRHRHKRNS